MEHTAEACRGDRRCDVIYAPCFATRPLPTPRSRPTETTADNHIGTPQGQEGRPGCTTIRLPSLPDRLPLGTYWQAQRALIISYVDSDRVTTRLDESGNVTSPTRPADGVPHLVNRQHVALLDLQRQAGNEAVSSLIASRAAIDQVPVIIQRQRRAGADRRVGYFTVGDPNLNYGNAAVFMPNLEDLPAAMMRFHGNNEWTMVLSIHGAEDVVSGQGGHVSRRSGNVYDAARVQQIFSSPQFQRWRDAHGPTHLVMNACQLNSSFEGAFISSLVRPGRAGAAPAQQPQGLGTGCRPNTTLQSITIGEQEVRTWAQYRNLSRANRDGVRSDLVALNRRWGYFGRPPVPEDQVLHYYFDEAPRGSWVQVVVAFEHQGTEIPFWNRATNTQFNQTCNRGIGNLRPRH